MGDKYTIYDLISAVKEGKLERVRQIVRFVPPFKLQDWILSEGYALLLDAVENKNAQIAKILLGYGSKVNGNHKKLNTPLHYATINGDIEIVEMLLNKGAEINAANRFDKTPLHSAVQSKKVKIVELLLSRGAKVDAKGEGGITALHIAVENGKIDIVEQLLNSRANINSMYSSTFFSRKDYTPLHLAVKENEKEIVKLLLSRGADVDAKGEDGTTALHLAVERGNLHIVEYLLNQGANINCAFTPTCRNGYTPLHLAVEGHFEDIMKLLLSRGANVDAKGADDTTALHLAAERGNGVEYIVEHLLNHGANTNCAYTSTIRSGYTPLHIAVERHFEDIMKLLLSRGANVDAKGDEKGEGKTALHIAVEKGNIHIVEHLLNHVANINAPTSSWRGFKTPLHLAVERHFENITKLLLSRGANVDAEAEGGTTALYIAVENGKIDIVEQLLNHGANINCASKFMSRKGYTPLHHAVNRAFEDIIKLLLRRGADVDAKGEDGTTALHIAAKSRNIDLVKPLVDSGANINAKGKYGKTALRIAYERWNEEIIEYLLNHGADINSAFTSYLREDGRTAFHLDEDFRYAIVDNILRHHMIKMETAKLYVNKGNLSFKRDESDKDFLNKCEEEIASMKSVKVNNANVSFYDILKKDINQLARYAGNESIVQVLRSDDYKKKFPIYAGMINSHFKKGEKRKELLEQSNNIFHLFFNNFGLSQECTEEIFSYLSNKDLRIFIDTCI